MTELVGAQLTAITYVAAIARMLTSRADFRRAARPATTPPKLSPKSRTSSRDLWPNERRLAPHSAAAGRSGRVELRSRSTPRNTRGAARPLRRPRAPATNSTPRPPARCLLACWPPAYQRALNYRGGSRIARITERRHRLARRNEIAKSINANWPESFCWQRAKI